MTIFQNYSLHSLVAHHAAARLRPGDLRRRRRGLLLPGRDVHGLPGEAVVGAAGAGGGAPKKGARKVRNPGAVEG